VSQTVLIGAIILHYAWLPLYSKLHQCNSPRPSQVCSQKNWARDEAK